MASRPISSPWLTPFYKKAEINPWLDAGMYMLPGIGNVWSLGRGIQQGAKAFGEGRIGAGLGHIALGGLGAVPIVGNMARGALNVGRAVKGVAGAGGLASRYLPTLSKGTSQLASAYAKPFHWMGGTAPGRSIMNPSSGLYGLRQQPLKYWGAMGAGHMGMGMVENNAAQEKMQQHNQSSPWNQYGGGYGSQGS